MDAKASSRVRSRAAVPQRHRPQIHQVTGGLDFAVVRHEGEGKVKPGDAFRSWFWNNKIFDLVAYQFYLATQILAPGMDVPAGYPHTPSDRQEKFDAWMKVRFGR